MNLSLWRPVSRSLFRLSNISRSGTRVATLTTSAEMASKYSYETLKVTSTSEFVYHVEINRPEKRNAMNLAFWQDMVKCFTALSEDPDCRAIVISGAGSTFSAGIDLQSLTDIMKSEDGDDVGRKAFQILNVVPKFQESFNVIEKCNKPVIAAVNGPCVGGGIDLITACDIRYCAKDSWFQVKEIDIGIVADVGTLQRLPRVVGNDSLVRELCYTARKLNPDEALSFGLVSRVLSDKDSLLKAAFETAAVIASKSPVAVQGTKMTLVYARDHTVGDGLAQVRTLNASMLQCEDAVKAAMGQLTKQPVTFSKL